MRAKSTERTSLQEEGRSYETRWLRWRSRVSVPFTSATARIRDRVVLPGRPTISDPRGLARRQLLQGDDGVVVGDAGLRRPPATVDEPLSLRPVDLQVARRHRRHQRPAAELAV